MEVERKHLTTAMSKVSQFIHSRSPSLAMKCVRIRSSKGHLRVAGSSVFGMCEATIPCEGELNIIVECDPFQRTIGLFSDRSVKIVEDRGKIKLTSGRSEVTLPVYEDWIEPSVGDEECSMEADSIEIVRCLSACTVATSKSETKMIEGARVITHEDKLHFSSGTSTTRAYAWCDRAGGETDVVIAHVAIRPLINILSRDDSQVEIRVLGSHVEFSAPGVRLLASAMPKNSGKLPEMYGAIRKSWEEGSEIWQVNREQAVEFIKHAAAFTTEEATGVWLRPRGDHLECEFDGRADGDFSPDFSVQANCRSTVEATCGESSDEVYIQNRLLRPAVEAMSCDFTAYVTKSGLFLGDGRCVIGMGRLARR